MKKRRFKLIDGHRHQLEKQCLLSILNPQQGDYIALLEQLSYRASLRLIKNQNNEN